MMNTGMICTEETTRESHQRRPFWQNALVMAASPFVGVMTSLYASDHVPSVAQCGVLLIPSALEAGVEYFSTVRRQRSAQHALHHGLLLHLGAYHAQHHHKEQFQELQSLVGDQHYPLKRAAVGVSASLIMTASGYAIGEIVKMVV